MIKMSVMVYFKALFQLFLMFTIWECLHAYINITLYQSNTTIFIVKKKLYFNNKDCGVCLIQCILYSWFRDHNSILIRSIKMQQYAGIYLLQNYSTCFGCPPHPSSGVHKIVTAVSGTGQLSSSVA